MPHHIRPARCPASFILAVMLAIVVGSGMTHPIFAAEEKLPPLSDTAELGYVQTAGNSETSTLGFKNTFIRNWETASFTLRAGGVRAENTTRTFTASGTASNFAIKETSATVRTAESYFFNGRFDRKISARFFWYVGAGWDRNRFAGINNRYIGSAGVGNVWITTDETKFKTDYAVTYTKEDDIVKDPALSDSFAGARFSWDFSRKLGATTTYGNLLILDDNFDHMSDFRGDMTNSLAVAMSKRLALKVNLQSLFDNKPALRAITFTDSVSGESVTVLKAFEKLDTVFTVSLVVNF